MASELSRRTDGAQASAGARARDRQRAILFVLGALCSVHSGCSFVRPEGDGGWERARRNQEIARAVQPLENPPPAAVETAAPSALDLETVLRLVHERNARVLQAARQVDVAEQRVYDSRGRLLPSAVGSARYTWYSDSQSVVLPSQLLQAFPQLQTPPQIQLRESESGLFNGTVVLAVDLSGELRHALRAAQAGYRGERARLWATTLEQDAAAMRAYFQLLEARRLRSVTDQSLEQVRQQLQQTQSKFDNGRVTKNELLVVQVTTRNLNQQRLQRDLAIDQARWTLNQLTGRAIDQEAGLTDVHTQPQLPDIEEALQTMQQHNPLAIALLEEQQRLEESLTSLERSRWPRFSGGGAIDYTTSDLVQPQQIESGFVGMTLDLGTDLRREAQIAEARAASEKNRAALRGLLQDLEAAVRSVHAATAERLAALQTAQLAVDQAEENRRIRQEQFDSGRVESDKVLEAEGLLEAQRAGAASALYQAHSRRAELQQLLGLPLNDLISSTR